MKFFAIAATLLTASLALAAPSATSSAATPAGSQIRTDQDPVYHLYLQDVDGQPILGPEASSGYFTITNTVQLNSATGGQPLFFNVNMTETTSYKSVSLDSTATTTDWTMSGDTIVAGGQQNFLVCPISGSANFDLFLQTGDDVPSSACTDWITIHLPCLC